VDLPDIPGKIVIQKKKHSSYVHYEYGRIYEPARKYNVSKRVVIGKQSQNNNSKLHPNPNFLKYFPSVDVSSIMDDPFRSCCLKNGSWMAIRSTIEHYELLRIVGNIEMVKFEGP